jgi:hypothetical protein
MVTVRWHLTFRQDFGPPGGGVDLPQAFQLPELAGRQGIKGSEKPLLAVAHGQCGAFQDQDHQNPQIDDNQDEAGDHRGQKRYGLQYIEDHIADDPDCHKDAQQQLIAHKIPKRLEQKADDNKAFRPEQRLDLYVLPRLRNLQGP